jgi:hypothetical protein
VGVRFRKAKFGESNLMPPSCFYVLGDNRTTARRFLVANAREGHIVTLLTWVRPTLGSLDALRIERSQMSGAALVYRAVARAQASVSRLVSRSSCGAGCAEANANSVCQRRLGANSILGVNSPLCGSARLRDHGRKSSSRVGTATVMQGKECS